jgi:metal-responsive CopG/Arc/MetJ family transcriptional regulator
MSKTSLKLTLQLPEGLFNEINSIITKEDLWMSSQDFIREAIKEKIERWKKENAVG